MSGIHNLKPGKVIKVFAKAGWAVRKPKGSSHVKLTKEDNQNILSIPMHKGKPVKAGLLRAEISKAGLTVDEFLKLYKGK